MAKKDEVEHQPKVNKKRLAWFLALLIIIAMTTGCLFAPAFDIVSVKSFDGDYVTSGEIVEKAKIKIGENIFRIPDGKIKKSIESLPYVKNAKIYRALPNKIVLKVEERVPYAIVKYLESFAITDKFGYILEIQKENTMKELPIIYGLNMEECKAGDKLSGTYMLKYENAIYILETAEKIKFPYHFSEINYDDITNVKLSMREKEIDIIYGEIVRENIEEKLGHLASILEKLGDKSGKIDMSNEDYLARSVFTGKE